MKTTLQVNSDIAALFYEKAHALESKGERHKYRALSYMRAARAIEGLDRGLDEIYQHGWLVGLQKIKGIGNRIAHDIEKELKKRKLITKK